MTAKQIKAIETRIENRLLTKLGLQINGTKLRPKKDDSKKRAAYKKQFGINN